MIAVRVTPGPPHNLSLCPLVATYPINTDSLKHCPLFTVKGENYHLHEGVANKEYYTRTRTYFYIASIVPLSFAAKITSLIKYYVQIVAIVEMIFYTGPLSSNYQYTGQITITSYGQDLKEKPGTNRTTFLSENSPLFSTTFSSLVYRLW